MDEPGTHAGTPRARYGRSGPRRRTAARVVVAAVALALVGWLTWAALAAATRDVAVRVLSFRVLDDARVQPSLEVVADSASTVTCTLRAQDSSHETTGIARVVVPPGARDRRVVNPVIETRNRAVAVTVVGCRTNP